MRTPPRIVVVGSSNADLVARAPRLPAPGETLLGDSFATVPGGKGANQAVAAARLGAAVTFVACVGADDLGHRALAGLAAEGMDATHVTVDQTAPTGIAIILVSAATGENSIVVVPGANARLSVDDVERARPAIETADILLCQLEIPLETVRAAIEIAHAAGVRTILNPAPARELPDSLLTCVSVLTPNEAEAGLLAGGADPERAALRLHARGVATVIVTLGAQGALVSPGSGAAAFVVPAFVPSAVVDTTAAGDCFSAAVAVALAEGDSLDGAVRFAGAAAALSVSRPGAQPSLPTREDVQRYVAG